ncbi:retinol dehydrogenase 11-like [Anticarsia gemmatalis]|uniref:retinol dehydrogenase 11-like n=1 Tax=Anticarsia gemmatalis TaxID=129554 RepID=UPI003F76AEF5
MFFVALFVFNLAVAIVFKVYCKLTTGICKCSKHLVGKVVIVTGSNTGIGYETAKDLAERGARVILACRNKEKGIKACASIIQATGNSDVHYRNVDLASLASVRAFADDIIKTEKRVDILVNNAAIYDVDNIKTEDGLSFAMQTNHFGPFLLTSLLLPILKASAPSRIINVASLAYRMAKIDFDNLNYEKDTPDTYKRSKVYADSKLCNILMTRELAKMLEGTGVVTNCLHPGTVATDMLLQLRLNWLKFLMPVLNFFSKTPWEGAQTTNYLAVSSEGQDANGKYFADCHQRSLKGIATDDAIARKLWEVSEKLVGLKK